MTALTQPISLLRPGRIVFGPGVAAQVGPWLAAQGLRRVLVVADAFNAGRVAALGLEGAVTVFGEITAEPTTADLDAVTRIALDCGAQAVVGFGGGSAMDLAKLAAVLPGSGQTLAEVVGAERVRAKRAVLVQVPTMALLEVSKARGGAPLAAAAKVLKGFVRIPVVLAVAVGAAVAGLGLPVPDALAFFTELLGRTAGPVALFAIGASLAGRRVTDGLGEIGLISFGKLVLHPLFVAAGMSVALGMDNRRAVIAVLLAALPVGGNLYVVAQSYGLYAERISSTILISTAIGVASFSVLAVALTG